MHENPYLGSSSPQELNLEQVFQWKIVYACAGPLKKAARSSKLIWRL